MWVAARELRAYSRDTQGKSSNANPQRASTRTPNKLTLEVVDFPGLTPRLGFAKGALDRANLPLCPTPLAVGRCRGVELAGFFTKKFMRNSRPLLKAGLGEPARSALERAPRQAPLCRTLPPVITRRGELALESRSDVTELPSPTAPKAELLPSFSTPRRYRDRGGPREKKHPQAQKLDEHAGAKTPSIQLPGAVLRRRRSPFSLRRERATKLEKRITPASVLVLLALGIPTGFHHSARGWTATRTCPGLSSKNIPCPNGVG